MSFDLAASSAERGWEVPQAAVHVLGERTSRYCLLIPVINEGDRLIGQLRRIQEHGFDIDVVVADGGSTDGSDDLERLRGLGVRALLVKQGDGKLSAQLRMGFAFALLEGYDGVITVDGNGKDDVAAVAAFQAALDEGFGFVQGSRFIPGGKAINTPRERYLAITLFHAPLTSVAARSRFTDTTNGFRAHSREMLLDERVAPMRTVFDTYELLAYLPIRAARLGYRCTEVPVVRAYPAAGAVPTKIHGRGAQFELVKILGRAALGRYAPGGLGEGSGPRATFFRFVLVNVLNTGLYWGLYLLLLLVLPYFWANATALVLAVAVAYVANARYAFGVATSRGTLVRYLVANGLTILLRMGVVWVLVQLLSLPEELAPPAAVAITTPAAFVLTRWSMTARPTRGDEVPGRRRNAATTSVGTPR